MEEVKDQSIALMVTSPPYNVGMEYEEKKSCGDYLEWLFSVWRTARKKLIPGGRFAINIANIGRNPYIPLASYITQQLLDLGMISEGEIIWLKPISGQKANTTFGSWRMPSNPALADRHEYVLIFRKDERKRDISEVPPHIKEKSRLSKEAFLNLRSSTWRINPVPKNGHPCPFPLEKPSRLISLYSLTGDVILDPFMGSGTTAVAAQQLDRRYIGYEIIKKYCDLAEKRLCAMTPPEAA